MKHLYTKHSKELNPVRIRTLCVRAIFAIIGLTSMLSFMYSCTEEEKKKKAEAAENHIKKGLSAFRTGDFDTAMEEYRTACREQPKSAEAHNYLGMALRYKYHETGDDTFRQEEVDAFTRAVELKNDWWVAQINLATTLWEMGNRKRASKYYENGLKLKPDHPDATAIKRRIATADSLGLEKKKKAKEN